MVESDGKLIGVPNVLWQSWDVERLESTKKVEHNWNKCPASWAKCYYTSIERYWEIAFL